MAAIDLHLDNLLSEGFSHFRMAHHFAKSVKTGQICQIIKEISTRCQINTNNYRRDLKVFSNFDQCSFLYKYLI